MTLTPKIQTSCGGITSPGEGDIHQTRQIAEHDQHAGTPRNEKMEASGAPFDTHRKIFENRQSK